MYIPIIKYTPQSKLVHYFHVKFDSVSQDFKRLKPGSGTNFILMAPNIIADRVCMPFRNSWLLPPLPVLLLSFSFPKRHGMAP